MRKGVRILFTSDVHGAISPRSYVDGQDVSYGFSRLSSLITDLRHENTIVIDGGDTLEGSPLTSFHVRNRAGELFPATRALKKIGYDFSVLGNHDFNYGKDVLKGHLEHSGAYNLTGNVSVDGQSMSEPYVIRTVGELKLAFVGATTHHVPRWELPANIEGMEFHDAFEFVRSSVESIKKDKLADVVVVVYHGGFERDPQSCEPICEENGENQAWRMLTEIEGIDVLLTGHQHRVMSGVAKGAGGHPVVYLQPGDKGSWLGRVEIASASDIKEGLLPVIGRSDEAFFEAFAEEEAACQIWLDQALGSSKVDLSVDNTLEAEVQKSQLVTFLNLVQAEATGADLSATAIFPGATGFGETITMRDLVSTYRFSNTLVVKRISGKVLKAYLERCAEYFTLTEDGLIVRSPEFDDPPADFNYDMLDGISYTINFTKPHAERIEDLRFQGEPISDDQEFSLAVNNYRAAGGGGFPMIAEAQTISENQSDMVELIANYISNHSPIDFEPVHNIKLVAEKE